MRYCSRTESRDARQISFTSDDISSFLKRDISLLSALTPARLTVVGLVSVLLKWIIGSEKTYHSHSIEVYTSINKDQSLV